LGIKLLNKTEKDYKEDYKPPKGIEEWFGYIGRNYYSPSELCERLELDAWGFAMLPMMPSSREKAHQKEGDREYVTGGMIKSKDDLKFIKLPKREDLKETYEYASNYISKYKRNYAVFPISYVGIDPTWKCFGLENFSYAIHDDIELVEEVLDIYTEWLIDHNKTLSEMEVDFIWLCDDIAFKSGLMFPPDFFRNVVFPRFKKVIDSCTKPVVFHSDGNILDIMEDLISMGCKGIHPIEPLAMDIFEFKNNYGNRVCTVGNIDLNTLSIGTPEETYKEVYKKISILSDNGSYIMSSSNSLTDYCDLKNIESMIKALNFYRQKEDKKKV